MPLEVSRLLLRPLLLAPPFFVCHFLEEAPGFVPWFNQHVNRDITSGLFWRVNLTGLAITLVVVAIEWFSRSSLSATLAIGWLSFLMLTNGIFHIVGTIVDSEYVPGLITAIVLYLPYYFWVVVTAVKSRRIGFLTLFVASILGSTPMLIHGYFILFRGGRLF